MTRNQISPAAQLVGDVRLGQDNVIEAGATIIGPLQIGDGNYIGPMSVLGASPQDDILAAGLRRNGLASHPEGGLSIGDRNVFREFATVHRGLTGSTVIGNGCYIMSYVNVQHDCHIRDGVKLANSVQMGGYSWIGRHAYVGLSATLHQFTVVGAHAMVGMGSVLTLGEVPIGSLLYGNPARLVRPNSYALESLGVSANDWWEELRAGSPDAGIPIELQEDFEEFERACAWRQAERVAVTEWRTTRRSETGR